MQPAFPLSSLDKAQHSVDQNHSRSIPPHTLLPSVTILSSSTQNIPGLVDGDGRGAAALVSLSSQDLIVLLAELDTESAPSVEMVLHSDGAADALRGPDRPHLGEGGSTDDLDQRQSAIYWTGILEKRMVAGEGKLTDGALVRVEV